MSLSKTLALILAAALAGGACVTGLGPGSGPGGDDDEQPDLDDPPPEPPPVPPSAVYRRGSLSPIFELTPRAEYGRLAQFGTPMADADFVALGNNFVSAAQKLDEIGAQLAQERGLPVAVNLVPKAEDRQRAQQIPFRGNPSDVELVRVGGRTKLFVPLGGDLTTPGNEVAIVDADEGAPIRLRVGLRPQRLAVHPSGLVFVCNQFSNYISIIDPTTNQLLRNADGPVEIATDYYCSDLAFVPRSQAAPDDDLQDLYVANSWRASVLRYGLQVTRDPLTNRPTDVRVIEPLAPNPANQPAAEIRGVGANPFRLALSEDRNRLYVANSRGGELARIDLREGTVGARVALNAPSIDAVHIGDSLFVPTTTRDRGLLASDEAALPTQVLAPPAQVTGLDGQTHVAHPGALFDRTRSYNFEDVRNGLLQVDFLLNQSTPAVYYTDDVSPEPNFVDAQKVLAGAIPQAIVRNRAGDRIYLAMSGSDLVQELEVRAGAFRVRALPNRIFRTAERPFALALDEERNRLLSVNWGGETVEIFDLGSRQRLRSIDLGYANPAYPATNIEAGEYFFYNADWSNNGRKSCATCHLDELLADGIGYANGATAPTAYHHVRPNYNLMTTDAYFWNGSFSNGSYASLASAAQTRTNCELILFGMIEGISSNPATRIGDPNNRVTNGQDAQCRPIVSVPGRLPDNFDQIAGIIAAQKQVGSQLIEEVTGRSRQDVTRLTDFYSVAELRLPPNPLKHLYQEGELDAQTTAAIDQGKQIFTAAGCGNCHDPNNQRHPFTDGREHGAGAEWRQRFIDTYFNDPRITGSIGGLPQTMLEAVSASVADPEINIHLDPIDYFTPFCFDGASCLSFEDPLAVRGNQAAESARLDLLVRINLADPDRGFIPGNVRGQPAVNTPSLRGIWWQTNMLRHGHAYSIAEAVLAPGHQGLRPGERGYAINVLGQVDVHGVTSTLTPAEVEALVLYLSTIE